MLERVSLYRQNSLDVAWELLMSPDYNELRSTIFVNRSEMLRFRQVTVNVVLGKKIEFIFLRLPSKQRDFVRAYGLTTATPFQTILATDIFDKEVSTSNTFIGSCVLVLYRINVDVLILTCKSFS